VIESQTEFEESERDAFYRLVAERRDIRHFRSLPIPEAVLQRVLWAGHRAGSVGFMQPWDFVIVRDRGRRARLRDSADRQRLAAAAAMGENAERASQFLRLKVEGILECDVVIVVTVDPTRGGNHVLGRYSDLETDIHSACCAIQNMWLASRAEGLGLGWVSFFHPGEVQQALAIPPHIRPLALLCLGWPEAFPARPLLEQVGWERRRRLRSQVHHEIWGEKKDDGLGLPEIPAVDQRILGEARERQAQLTKPPGSLGRLEELSVQLAGIARTLFPRFQHRVLFSARPAGAASGPTAILLRQHQARLVAIQETEPRPSTRAAVIASLRQGSDQLEAELEQGADIVLLGSAGDDPVSNAVLGCALTGLDPSQASSAEYVAQVRTRLASAGTLFDDAVDVLAAFGTARLGIAAGIILAAALRRRPVVIDGVEACLAALVAVGLQPNAAGYLIAGGDGSQPAQAAALGALGLHALLRSGLEAGDGALAALPLIEASVSVLNEMSTFAEAEVSNRS
jgi:nicotinate-nucleotide--dimethylbenzimidazole phosphoribosyltransferase